VDALQGIVCPCTIPHSSSSCHLSKHTRFKSHLLASQSESCLNLKNFPDLAPVEPPPSQVRLCLRAIAMKRSFEFDLTVLSIAMTSRLSQSRRVPSCCCQSRRLTWQKAFRKRFCSQCWNGCSAHNGSQSCGFFLCCQSLAVGWALDHHGSTCICCCCIGRMTWCLFICIQHCCVHCDHFPLHCQRTSPSHCMCHARWCIADVLWLSGPQKVCLPSWC